MFSLAALVSWLLSPLSIAWLLGLAAAALWRRHPRTAKSGAIAAFIVLWIGSTPLLEEWLSSPLENRYASLPIADVPPADAIVVLGGAIVGAHPPSRPNLGMSRAADRVWQAAALYRAGKAPWIVVAAGALRPRPGLQVEAEAIVQMLVVLGVPEAKILVDRDSRNTRENAANARVLIQKLKAHRVLLVTSALHLPRAVRTFENAWAGAGMAIVPIPSDVSGEDDYFTLYDLVPSVDAGSGVTRALKEYAGTVVLGIMETVTQ